jgi:hypothetical protein
LSPTLSGGQQKSCVITQFTSNIFVQMAWFTILSAAGVLVGTSLGYFIRVAYNHRRKINELRKQGVVGSIEISLRTTHY